MVSGIITVALLVLFVGGWIWIWSPRRKREFDAAARLPLEEKRNDDERDDVRRDDEETQP